MTHVRLQFTDDWVQDSTTAVTGTVKIGDKWYQGESFAQRLETVSTAAELSELLQSVRGYYACILERGDHTIVAVDHMRTIPLFYTSDGSMISDLAQELEENIGSTEFDPVAEAEYISLSYVMGSETLYPEIKQIRAGEIVDISSDKIEQHQYYTYTPQGDGCEKTTLDEALNTAYDRFAEFAGDRPVYISLSGGYDSRLSALMLSQRNVDLRSYSYGDKNWNEVTTARQIANALDIPWHHISFTADGWYNWFRSDERKDYYHRAHNFDAVPGLNAVRGILKLREEVGVEENAICLHSSGIPSVGEHIKKKYLKQDSIDSEDFITDILETHYRYWDYDDILESRFKERLSNSLGVNGDIDIDAALAAYGKWEWQERQAKWMAAAAQEFDFAGLNWWFPLYDRDFMDVWGSLPRDQRYDKAALKEYTDDLEVSLIGSQKSTTLTEEVKSISKEVIKSSPLVNIARQIRKQYRESRLQRDDHPLSVYGVLSEEQFNKWYDGDRPIRAFRAMQAADRLSFSSPDDSDIPSDGVIRWNKS